jgi:hypothetical protein
MSILVTGMGRSGTMFLAKQLSKSKEWVSSHERETSLYTDDIPQRVIDRFTADRYIEVNSYLRHIAHKIPADKKFILIRNPLDIARSIKSRGRHDINYILKHINDALVSIDECISNYDFGIISFKEITHNLIYLNRLIKNSFGITDINQSMFEMIVINANPVYTDLTEQELQLCRSKFLWFIDKYMEYM